MLVCVLYVCVCVSDVDMRGSFMTAHLISKVDIAEWMFANGKNANKYGMS